MTPYACLTQGFISGSVLQAWSTAHGTCMGSNKPAARTIWGPPVARMRETSRDCMRAWLTSSEGCSIQEMMSGGGGVGGARSRERGGGEHVIECRRLAQTVVENGGWPRLTAHCASGQ